MASGIFSKLVNCVKCFFWFILNIPNLIKKQYHRFLQDCHNLKYNIKNFAEANINLGIYHVNNENYNDAIFRFKLVDRFFKPNDPLVHYWLGWAYFLKKNYNQALVHLEKGASEDKINLHDFIKKIDNVSKVPNEIYSMYRGITAASFVDKFATKKNYHLPREFIIQLMTEIDNIPKEFSILDLGSNFGLLGSEICKRMQEGFTLTGVEASKGMIDLQKKCFPDAKYDEIINAPVDDFLLSSEKKQYNIVVSLDGFANNSDLSIIFSKIHNILALDGYFAFTVPASNMINFSKKYLEFSFNKDYITDILKKNGFKIINWLELELAIKNNYFIFICKKMRKV